MIPVKKQIVLAFLCGMVIPMAMMALPLRAKIQQEETLPMNEPEVTQTAANHFDSETDIMVLTDSGRVQPMKLDEYLTGVVLSEMPAEFEQEALKAQAAVARTYTCKRMNNAKHDAAAVCTDSACCQGYRSPESYLEAGGTEEAIEKVRQAVAQTDSMVLTYDGELIDATYFSCSGGTTEDAVAVWGQDVPYLQSVESPGEEDAPRYEESVSFTAEEFSAMTGCTSSEDPENWFGEVVYTDGGGVDTIQICGEEFTGVELRQLLGLRSTAFTISVDGDCINIETRGFGHRVGMSQYGAQAMAQSGSSWKEILAHYYQGTKIECMQQG